MDSQPINFISLTPQVLLKQELSPYSPFPGGVYKTLLSCLTSMLSVHDFTYLLFHHLYSTAIAS